jgi:transglutaminase-like putative cysteine protease
MQHLSEFLRPAPGLDSDNPDIGRTAKDLCMGLKEPSDKARRLFYWVRDEIKYTPLVSIDTLQNYRASQTLERGRGFCVEKAALLAALARAVGIPARVRLADIRNHLVSDRLIKVMGTNLFSCHGYSELYLEKKWVKATPAFDLAMCRENRIAPVEFDARHDGIFHSHNLDGELHIEYVRDRGFYTGVPMDEILADWLQVYGIDSLERLKRYLEEEKDRGTG